MVSRRHFLQSTTAAALASQALAQSDKPIAPSERVQIALIGAGNMGTGDTSFSLGVPGVKLVAVCDIYEGRLTRAKERWGQDIFTTRDYHEVLSRRDVDAMIVATPDHSHAQIASDAMKAGKDVYCEKPMVHLVEQGLEVVRTQAETKRIMLVGSQRVSSVVYQKAKDLFAAGAIGELNLVEAWWDRNAALGAWQYSIPLDASPETVDWDRFLASAPKRPFDATRLFRWRNYRDYGAGVSGDLFVHLFSGIHFVTGAIGPSRVFATGGLRYWKDGRDVPDVFLGLYEYDALPNVHPAFNIALRVNFVSGAGESSGFRFVGSEGIMKIDTGVSVSKSPRAAEPGYNIDTFSSAAQKAFLAKYHEQYPQTRATAAGLHSDREEIFLPPHGYSDHRDHHRNFIAAVRDRKPVVEDPTFGFRAAGPALLSNVSYYERRVMEWNPETMTIRGKS